MPPVPERLAALIDYFASVPDDDTRAQLLIEYADRFAQVPSRIASRPFPEGTRVPHCESEAFVFAEDNPDATLKLHFAVENPHGISAKAVAVILDKTLSGAPLDQVAQVPTDFLSAVFGKNLSMGKGLGLTGMVEMVQAYARRALRRRTLPA